MIYKKRAAYLNFRDHKLKIILIGKMRCGLYFSASTLDKMGGQD